jgi:hypothetical protein
MSSAVQWIHCCHCNHVYPVLNYPWGGCCCSSSNEGRLDLPAFAGLFFGLLSFAKQGPDPAARSAAGGPPSSRGSPATARSPAALLSRCLPGEGFNLSLLRTGPKRVPSGYASQDTGGWSTKRPGSVGEKLLRGFCCCCCCLTSRGPNSQAMAAPPRSPPRCPLRTDRNGRNQFNSSG